MLSLCPWSFILLNKENQNEDDSRIRSKMSELSLL
jgi:hypothetical protein